MVARKCRSIQSSLLEFRRHCTLVYYVPRCNKVVIFLSAIHEDDEIDEAIEKPDLICCYNRTKDGVETVDELYASYNTARYTNRWSVVILYRLLYTVGVILEHLSMQNMFMEKKIRTQNIDVTNIKSI